MPQPPQRNKRIIYRAREDLIELTPTNYGPLALAYGFLSVIPEF